MRDREPAPPPEDPRDWAPMHAYGGRRVFDIVDPVVEPLWSGTRVLAHITVTPGAEPPASVALIEESGYDLAPALPELAAAIVEGFLVLDAIVDGIITGQVGLDGVGAAAIPEVASRPTEMFLRSSIDFDVNAGRAAGRGAAVDEPAPVDGFVAVDLLRIDGTVLLEVPLLERKRLLESAVSPGPLVRISTHVRPPIDSWIATWKSMGLKGGILKAANSRYHPNQDTIEWRAVERLGGRR